MKSMGAAIAGDLQDHYHCFGDELRKLDLQLRGDAIATSNEDTTPFHLVNFFLVAESRAFTYEQMRLPGEAFLQQEELRVLLPETEPKVEFACAELVMFRVTLDADVLEFRSSLRDRGEIDAARGRQYFSRELGLLFQMHYAQGPGDRSEPNEAIA